MGKRGAVFVTLIAVTALGFSYAALLVKKEELQVLNDAYDLMKKIHTEINFADFVEHYDDDNNQGDK